MLKKGDIFLNHMNISKKNKMYTEPNESYSENNKENHATKSLLDHFDDSNEKVNRQPIKINDPSYNGSTMVSPTFQTQELISLKDQKFKVDKGYVNINFSLKDAGKKMDDNHRIKKVHEEKGKENSTSSEEMYRGKLRQIEELKTRLIGHYENKKYWKKIQRLFQQEGVDAVIAWQDAIDKYKTIKDQNKEYEQQLLKISTRLQQKQQKIHALEKQIMQDKNQTKILSIKKCKGCESLLQKEKEYFELYENHKKNVRCLEEMKENVQQSSEQHKISEERYQNIKHLKEELEKKNVKLIEKQKELNFQLQKLQKMLKQDCSNSKELHIQKQKQKQAKHQLQKALNKMDQKYKRQIGQLHEDIKYKAQQLENKQNMLQKIKTQLSNTKQRLSKLQFDFESMDEEMKIKGLQFQDIKKRHIQNMNEQLRKRNQLAEILKNKEEQLKKSYENQDQMENIKLSLQLQLNKQVKNTMEKSDLNKSQEDYIRQLQQKLKEHEQSEHRIKEVNQVFSVHKQAKNNQNLGNLQYNQANMPNNGLLRKISVKIRQIYTFLTEVNTDNPEPYQRKKYKQQILSEERQGVNLLKSQKYLVEINTELSNFINKYNYIYNQNENLKKQLQDEISYKQQEYEQLRREIKLKEEAIKYIAPFVPEQLKELALQFLQFTEKLSLEPQQEAEYQEYEELKERFDHYRREWKQNGVKMQKRMNKMEQQMQRLREENDELRRRGKGKQIKKMLMSEYEQREVFSKKNIGRKYNIDF